MSLDKTEWEAADRAYVASIFPESWAPSTPSPFPATWKTIVMSGQAIVPAPIPTPVPGPPTLFAVWELVYDRLLGDLGDEQAPVRFGRLVIAGFLQGGARTGPLSLLRKALRAALDQAAEGPLDFTVQLARPLRVGEHGSGFWQENLIVPFSGG